MKTLPERSRDRQGAVDIKRGPLSVVRGCLGNADADFATLVHGVTASTEPRMKRAVLYRLGSAVLCAECSRDAERGTRG
jgi:hypothetical protein